MPSPSLLSLIAMAMNPLGLFLAGVLGDGVGSRAGLWLGGGTIAALSLLALSLPAVRALNTRDEPLSSSAPSVPVEVSIPARVHE